MVKLESFKRLSKPQDDLLTKAFPYVNHFGLHFKDTKAKDFTFRVSAKQPQGKPFSTGVWLEKKFSNGVTFREDFDDTQVYKAAVDYIPPAEPNLKVHGEVSTQVGEDPNVKPKVSAEYTFPNAKASLAFTKDPVITLTTVAGIENAGLGFEVGYDWPKQKLTTYNASLYLIEPSYRLVLKHLSDPKAKEFGFGKVNLSGFSKVDSSLSVGAEIEYDNKTETPTAKLGVQKVLDEFHTVKLRVSDSGEVATSATHKLNDNVAVTTSSSLAFTSLSAWPKFQFGFKLRLTS